MNKSKIYPFYEYNIISKKRGICFICGEEIYYGIGILRPARGDIDICGNCAKKITRIYLRLC